MACGADAVDALCLTRRIDDAADATPKKTRVRTCRRHRREECVSEKCMKLLLALPQWGAVAEPVVHARATDQPKRRETED